MMKLKVRSLKLLGIVDRHKKAYVTLQVSEAFLNQAFLSDSGCIIRGRIASYGTMLNKYFILRIDDVWTLPIVRYSKKTKDNISQTLSLPDRGGGGTYSVYLARNTSVTGKENGFTT